jgi:putative component of membrane protein insertase Oxa1/YidC/SpoIIIJ protein YidD
LWAIRVYQRFISPRKGFRCAYSFHTGHGSCSALGYRAIRRFGVVDGINILHSRLHKCGVAYRRYRPAPSKVLIAQAGFCDCDCGTHPCDIEWPCDCGPDSRKKKKQNDRDVTLPPRRPR